MFLKNHFQLNNESITGFESELETHVHHRKVIHSLTANLKFDIKNELQDKFPKTWRSHLPIGFFAKTVTETAFVPPSGLLPIPFYD